MLKKKKKTEDSLLKMEEDLTRMEEDLTCPVCLELYADPLMMPCSHSICKACLLDIMKSRSKAEKQDMECPTCRMLHVMRGEQVESMPKNLALENIVFRFQEIQSLNLSKGNMSFSACTSPTDDVTDQVTDGDTSSEVFDQLISADECGMCEEPRKLPANWWCQQCQVAYCNACLDRFHPRRGSLKEHKVCRSSLKKSTQKVLHCHDHPKEKAHIFCDTCQTVACHFCVCQGHGSHCGHVILDIETARTQLQNVLKNAKDQLDNLTSVLEEKNDEISAQQKALEILHEKSRQEIINQHSTLRADLVTTLDELKLQALCRVDATVQHHFDLLAVERDSVGATWAQCQGLSSACHSLHNPKIQRLSQGPDPNLDIKVVLQNPDKKLNLSSGSHESEVKRIMQSRPYNIISRSIERDENTDNLEVSFSSSFDPKVMAGLTSSPNFLTGDDNEKSNSDDKKTLNLSTPIQEIEGPLNDNNGHGQKLILGKITKGKESNHHKIMQVEKKRNKSRGKSLPIAELSSNVSDTEKNKRLSNPECVSMFSFTSSHVKKALFNKNLKQNVQIEVSQNLPMQGNKVDCLQVVRQVKSDKKQKERLTTREIKKNIDETQEKGIGESETKFEWSGDLQVCSRDALLLHAGHVGPILDQVSGLCKDALCEDKPVRDVETIKKYVSSAVSDFQSYALSFISALMGPPPPKPAIIIPTVRSAMSPAVSSGAGLAGRRVQSRTLITWGFTSTTFSADPVNSGQWKVTVQRNASHIGDVHSGYLFGIGVSTCCLGNKDQVGMSLLSYGVVCTQGQLTFSHNGHQSPIATLIELPVTVTLTLSRGRHGCILSYKVLQGDALTDMCGRRLIGQQDLEKELESETHKEEENQKNPKVEEREIFPVFTVSQRVKMHFSDTLDN